MICLYFGILLLCPQIALYSLVNHLEFWGEHTNQYVTLEGIKQQNTQQAKEIVLVWVEY